MSFHSIKFNQTSNTMTANLAGRLCTCLFKPLTGGAIPPGTYKLSAPMQNSVYGPFALLSSASRFTGMGQGGSNTYWIEPRSGWIEPRTVGWIEPRTVGWIEPRTVGWIDPRTVGWIEPRIVGWIEPRAGSLGSSKGRISSSDWVESPATYLNRHGLFVLVGKPLGGRNTIEITGGFAEFISALAKTGGVEVTLS